MTVAGEVERRGHADHIGRNSKHHGGGDGAEPEPEAAALGEPETARSIQMAAGTAVPN